MPSRSPYVVMSLAAVFSPMPGHAGQVVAGVAAQRRVVEVLRGRDAEAPLGDAGLVVERVVGDAALVVEHLDVRVARRAGTSRGRR